MSRCKESGVALLMVIFIIVGVALIAGPLAYTMIAHEVESLTLVDSSRGMTGAYGAMNHSIMKLYNACGDNDNTRRSDVASEYAISDLTNLSLAPLAVHMKLLDEEIMNEHASWGATVVDQQSLINLNSLTPRLCINLLGELNADLIRYRVSGEEGTFKLFRTIYEARKLGVSDADMAVLEQLTTVWSGPNIYGYYFSSPIPASVDNSGVIHVYSPDIANRIAAGFVIRMISGEAPDYVVSYSRIISITQEGNVFNMVTEPTLNYADECFVSIDIPRPINVNTASVEVLKALFTGVHVVGGSEITVDDSETLIRAILEARKANPIEGYLEMARLVLNSFGEETDKSRALLKSISYPAPNLYSLSQYTAPLCYNSDDIYEISSFAFIGGKNWRAKADEDLISVVSITPPGENVWSFKSQYDWQNLVNCGFGPYSVTGPNPCFVLPPDGNIFDIDPDKTEGDLGYVELTPANVGRDDRTLFIAHFDNGTTDSVFDAYSRNGDGKAAVNGLEVTEDPDESAISSFGVRIASGCSLLYDTESNLPWTTSDASLKMAQPLEFEMWIRLADDWVPAQNQVLFDLSNQKEFENVLRLWWHAPDALVLTICDAGLEQNRFHYKVPLPDANNYVSFSPGGNYHIRVVVYRTWQNYMSIMIDGKKLPGFYVSDDGLNLPGAMEMPISDGVSSRLSDYEWTLPPVKWVGTTTSADGQAQYVTTDGSLLTGKAKTSTQTSSIASGGRGFIAEIQVVDENGADIPDGEVAPNATSIPVVSVDGFPDQGILYFRSGDAGEYILYKGLNKEGTPQQFTECERGYTIGFDDGYAVGSVGQAIPNHQLLQLINLRVSGGYSDYPPRGHLYIPATEEVISYMGKSIVGGQECFILNALSGSVGSVGVNNPPPGYGRGQMGTAEPAKYDIPANSPLIQLFNDSDSWFNFKKGDMLTIIDNDDNKQYMNLAFVSPGRGWLAFDTSVSRPYYVKDPATLFQKYARVLKFPSSELPTVRHESFSLGSDINGNDPFDGWIDEFRVITKTQGASGDYEYQPYELYYGRYSGPASGDLHLVIANPRQGIDENGEEPVRNMTGECFALLDSYANPFAEPPDKLHNEAVFMAPTDNNPETMPTTSVKLNAGPNNFDANGIEVASTGGFPPYGYIVVEGSYESTRIDQFSSQSTPTRSSVHIVYYYGGLTGTSFTTLSRFQPYNDPVGTSGTLNIPTQEIADRAEITVALISTEMKFAKRGALWTEKNEGETTGGDFPEGSRIMCLRYPFGTLLTDSIDPESEKVSFKHLPADIEDEPLHFEIGTQDKNSLSVVGCDLQKGAEDRLVWDIDFHGCFGTTPQSYSDDVVVTLLPVRYYDRSKKESNSRHLRYLTAQTFKPGMRITALEWQEDMRLYDEMGIRILMRIDNSAPWESEPGDDNSTLREFLSPGDEKFEITSSNDTMSFDYFPGNFAEFRIFFEWTDGAYLSNAWKDSARLLNFRMYYERPNQVLSSRKSVY